MDARIYIWYVRLCRYDGIPPCGKFYVGSQCTLFLEHIDAALVLAIVAGRDPRILCHVPDGSTEGRM